MGRWRDLVCPDCHGVLWEVQESRGRRWYCLGAIGEVAWDHERRQRYIPQPSRHRWVKSWDVSDREIAEQLFDLGGDLDTYAPPRKMRKSA
jgi:uncharacterized protein YbaR (Trm112 family)